MVFEVLGENGTMQMEHQTMQNTKNIYGEFSQSREYHPGDPTRYIHGSWSKKSTSNRLCSNFLHSAVSFTLIRIAWFWFPLNKAITLNVTAQGKNGSQIVGYSFDNGVTWQSTNTMTYSGNQNKTVTIKVKDEQGNISTGTNQTGLIFMVVGLIVKVGTVLSIFIVWVAVLTFPALSSVVTTTTCPLFAVLLVIL